MILGIVKPRARILAAALVGSVVLPACASGATGGAGMPHLSIVTAENFWGDIARQLAGNQASVTSILSDPNADPHEYETNPTDARAFASADYVVINGAGYDAWAQKLLDANPASSRKVLDVALLLGKRDADNPHFWYSPSYLETVADRISSDLTSIDVSGSSQFRAQRSTFEELLTPYHQRIAAVSQRFGGVRVAATESLFADMAAALNLDLVSPAEFMKAVAEGTDPPVSSVRQFQDLLTSATVKLLVYNEQTVTSLTTSIRQLAASSGVPVVGVSETLRPPGTSFQDWQTFQLTAIFNALSTAAFPVTPSP